MNWWLPPVNLVCRNIGHACKCKAKGTLIIPFWLIILPDGKSLAPLIHSWWAIGSFPNLFVHDIVVTVW